MIYIVIRISKQTPGQVEKLDRLYVNTHRYIITYDELPVIFDVIISWLSDRIYNLLFATAESGWQIDEMEVFKVAYHHVYNRARIGDFSVEYPDTRGKKFIFNPPTQNKLDDNCLPKCLAAQMIKHKRYKNQERTRWDHIAKMLEDPKNIPKHLKTDGLTRLSFDNLSGVEKLNQMKINCYRLEKDANSHHHEIRLMKRGNKNYAGNICNLLFYKYKNESKNCFSWHVFLIKVHIQRFLRNFMQVRLGETGKICNFCFNPVRDSEVLKEHKTNYCMNRGLNSRIIYPKENEFVRFRNWIRCQKTPIVAFTDFECGLIKAPNGTKIHLPLIYALVVVDTERMEVLKHTVYRGLDCVDHFLDNIKAFWKEYNPRKNSVKYGIDMTIENQREFMLSDKCFICKRTFIQGEKTAHHDHLIEKQNYIGALCNRCNLQITVQQNLTVVAHNANYDISLILKHASNTHGIQVITQKSDMKYFYLSVDKRIKLVDSYQILKSSLAKLVKEFKDSNELVIFDQVVLEKFKTDKSDEVYTLLSEGKMCFPYDYVDDFSKLSEPRLPGKDKFYNSLRESDISESDFLKTRRIYDLTKCRDLGDYYEIYCLGDVLFLADVYTHWRDLFSIENGLDVSTYLTLPSFSFDAMLKFNYEENPEFGIELMADVELSNLVLENVRGGYCTLISHHEKLDDAANLLLNLPEENLMRLKRRLAVSVIEYFDVNSNYSGAMTEKLPIGGFYKLPEGELQWLMEGIKSNKFDFEKRHIGYYCHVTLAENSDKVKSETDMFPMALQKVKINYKQLGEYTRSRMSKDHENKTYERLTGHHNEKKKQLYDAQSLQQFVAKGLIIKEVHGAYAFKQEIFLKNYILKNIQKRKLSRNSMESSMYKLMNNAIFGKMLCNALNYSNKTYVCRDKYNFMKRICSESFVNYHVLRANRVLIISRKRTIRLRHPNYVGFSILEKARRAMKTFFYDNILVLLEGRNVKLLYSDTDSFVLKYYLWLDKYTDDAYFRAKFEALSRLKDAGILDTSNFPKNHPLYDVSLKGALFALKSENPRYIYGEWVGIAPKVYTFIFIGYHVNKITKKIKAHVNEKFAVSDALNYLFTDIASAVFEVRPDLVKDLSDLEEQLKNVNIFLENWHSVKISYSEYLEIIPSNRGSKIEHVPLCSSFYSKDVMELVVRKKSNHSSVNNIYFLEIDGDFNVKIFKYALNFFCRPIPVQDILSDAEIMLQKSKTCAGVPAYKSNNITSEDYKEALTRNRDQIKKVQYQIMKNDRGTYKTVNVEKVTLLNQCVKRYFKSKDQSFSFGSNEIPIIHRSDFACNSRVTSDEEEGETESDTSDETSVDYQNTPDTRNTGDIPVVDIFASRREKFSNQFSRSRRGSDPSPEFEEIAEDMINDLISTNSISSTFSRDADEDFIYNLKRRHSVQNAILSSDSEEISEDESLHPRASCSHHVARVKPRSKKLSKNTFLDSEAFTLENNASSSETHTSAENDSDIDFIDDSSYYTPYALYLQNTDFP